MKLCPTPRRALSLAIAIAAAHGMQAWAAPTVAGTAITNTATASYLDSTLVARTATSNTVTTVVQQVAAVAVSTGTAKPGSANNTVVYAHTITNNGNGPDSFTLTQSNTGAFQMANVQFFADANGDGVADNATPITTTGNVAPGDVIHVVAVATLPAGATLAATNNLTVTATSVFNTAINASATDVTTVAAASALDLTVDSAGAGAKGAGAGAEQSAVTTNTVAAGNTTRFNLYLNNSGTGPDTFALSASTDPAFGSATPLPSGWTVTFKDASGATITAATVAGGTNTVVYADVQVPAGTNPGTVDLYFRALSATTSVGDKIHEAVLVTAAAGAPTIQLVKKQALDANCDGTPDTAFSSDPISAGAIPGACIRYEITATNVGQNGVTAVVINDTVPANTTYVVPTLLTGATASQGLVTAPLPGLTGVISAGVGLLAPQGSAKLTFGVRINP